MEHHYHNHGEEVGEEVEGHQSIWTDIINSGKCVSEDCNPFLRFDIDPDFFKSKTIKVPLIINIYERCSLKIPRPNGEEDVLYLRYDRKRNKSIKVSKSFLSFHSETVKFFLNEEEEEYQEKEERGVMNVGFPKNSIKLMLKILYNPTRVKDYAVSLLRGFSIEECLKIARFLDITEFPAILALAAPKIFEIYQRISLAYSHIIDGVMSEGDNISPERMREISEVLATKPKKYAIITTLGFFIQIDSPPFYDALVSIFSQEYSTLTEFNSNHNRLASSLTNIDYGWSPVILSAALGVLRNNIDREFPKQKSSPFRFLA